MELRKIAEFSCPETYRELWVGEGGRAGDKEDLFNADLAALMAADGGAESRFHFNRGGPYTWRRDDGDRAIAQRYYDYAFMPMPTLIVNGGPSYTWGEDWYENGGSISTYWTTHVEGTGCGEDEEMTHTIFSREIITRQRGGLAGVSNRKWGKERCRLCSKARTIRDGDASRWRPSAWQQSTPTATRSVTAHTAAGRGR